jgi:hypothetical protein
VGLLVEHSEGHWAVNFAVAVFVELEPNHIFQGRGPARDGRHGSGFQPREESVKPKDMRGFTLHECHRYMALGREKGQAAAVERQHCAPRAFFLVPAAPAGMLRGPLEERVCAVLVLAHYRDSDG